LISTTVHLQAVGIINQSDLLAIDKFIVDGKKKVGGKHKRYVFILKTNGGVALQLLN
jgi:hypothetical protein